MTLRELVAFYALFTTLLLVTCAAAILAGFYLFEPSIWRLLPLVLWLVILRVGLGRYLMRSVRPANIAARWHRYEQQDRQQPE